MWFEWNYEGLWEFLWGTTSRTIQKTSQDPWPAPENWLKILQMQQMQQMQLRKKSNKMQQFDDSIKIQHKLHQGLDPRGILCLAEVLW